MPPAGRNQCATRLHSISVLRFSHFNLAHRIKPARKSRGKALWHVLNNHDGRTIKRQFDEDIFNSLGASRGGADRHNALSQRITLTGGIGRWQ